MEKVNEQNINDILEVIYKDDKLLTGVLTSLLNNKKVSTAADIVSKIGYIPQDVIIHIFNTLNKDAFKLFTKEIKTSLYDTWVYDDDIRTITVGKKISETLESKKGYCMPLYDVSVYEEMTVFIEDNYIEAKCKCGNDLLDPNGEGIYTDVNLPFVFNRYTQCFEEVVEEYAEITGRYRCGHCDRDVTDSIRNII